MQHEHDLPTPPSTDGQAEPNDADELADLIRAIQVAKDPDTTFDHPDPTTFTDGASHV